jgi:hypothetical protein
MLSVLESRAIFTRGSIVAMPSSIKAIARSLSLVIDFVKQFFQFSYVVTRQHIDILSDFFDIPIPPLDFQQ